MRQYLSVGDEIGVVRKLRFVAIDRRKPHLKRNNINPFRGHIEIRILHLIIGVSYHRIIERMNTAYQKIPPYNYSMETFLTWTSSPYNITRA